ncbi:PBECR2 nuclease fold domain-containing protein [Gallaecimonas xiamenensis]|uniref:Putative head morphogenesis protein SPP1 gp7 n=1 Tax=Gallaecimonas xiamenensis 3-C-1 TaxID=745411 RepID=K2KD68_9GAMM|nr:PBECR2 nuclease fold domain-containing protein [Gallaecimonas xiamenensis]EKE75195.1 putative head morphogenesis protein SPP1 gp7 [Gallaecimonas xiamenensis 3-C-1]
MAEYGGVQFQQAIDWFKGKLNMPTAAWDDIWGAMHTRAFVVAGAQKADLLTDLRRAMTSAIEDGTPLNTFKSQFKDIVAKHGWEHTGNADWRARIIYDTNLRQSYNAGRWQQLQSFDYWEYRHGNSESPRPDHLAWNGKLLPKTSAWWRTHFPQNGWGCTCFVRGYTSAQVKRRGLTVADEPALETWDYTNKKTGEVIKVPKGIDAGFDYSPGEATFGRQLSDDAMAQWQAAKGDAWQSLTPGNWQTAGRPERLPVTKTDTALADRVQSKAELLSLTKKVLGGAERVFDKAPVPVYVNAETLAEHIDIARAPMLPLLPELIQTPAEVWAAFEQHKGTGQVQLRWRFISMVKAGKYQGQLLVAQVARGMLEAWTFIPVKQLNYINKQRQGILVHGGE